MKTLKTKWMAGMFAAVMGISMMAPALGMAMGVKEFESLWGKPAKVEKAQDGSELLYYTADHYVGLEGYQIFKVQPDGQVIDKGFSDSVWEFTINGNQGCE